MWVIYHKHCDLLDRSGQILEWYCQSSSEIFPPLWTVNVDNVTEKNNSNDNISFWVFAHSFIALNDFDMQSSSFKTFHDCPWYFWPWPFLICCLEHVESCSGPVAETVFPEWLSLNQNWANPSMTGLDVPWYERLAPKLPLNFICFYTNVSGRVNDMTYSQLHIYLSLYYHATFQIKLMGWLH